MARHQAQRKRQKFSDFKYILLCLLCVLSYSHRSPQRDEFAFEPIIIT